MALESVLIKIVTNCIEAARSAESENYSHGYLNPGLYAWAFGEQGGEESLALMDCAPQRVGGDLRGCLL